MKFFLSIIVMLSVGLRVSGQVKELVWEDNFNTGQLNTEYWNIETGIGVNGDFGTGQVDRATDRSENISFSNSVPGAEDACLVITAQKELYIDRNYTSGRINTAGKKSWGPGYRIVARIYPRDVKNMGQGFAFWMMPDELPSGWDYIMWPQGGEIDIMEYVGAIPFHNLGSVHYAWFWQNNEWADWNHGHQGAYYSFENKQVPNPAEPGYGNYSPNDNDVNAGSHGFHNYGIDWYADRIEFFIDDNVYHIHYLNDGGAFAKDGEDQFAVRTIDGRRVGVSEYSNHFKEWYPFEHLMYPILSVGVGGSEYTYGGAVGTEAIFPCSVYIDWVKVYKLDITAGTAGVKEKPVFDIYPNPVSDKLTITFPEITSERATIRLVNLNGSVIRKIKVGNRGKVIIDTKGIADGAYLVHFQDREVVTSSRFVISNSR